MFLLSVLFIIFSDIYIVFYNIVAIFIRQIMAGFYMAHKKLLVSTEKS